MKIIFFGTPEFAVPSLKILVENGYEIPVVITAPGKKAGRGLQIREPAIKVYADEVGIPVLQPEKLSDPEFIDSLTKYNANLFIVVAFRMLPESVWTIPKLGTFNLHSSYLPAYRGAAPINRVIMNGETETGITTFFLQHAIDTGNIIQRQKVEILPEEAAGELHDRLKMLGAQLVLDTVRLIENNEVQTIAQDDLAESSSDLITAPKIFPDDCLIHWTKPSHQIHNQIRGLSPYPGAFTFISDTDNNRLQLKIFRSRLTGIQNNSIPGTILLQDKMFLIQTADALIEILELQLEGKKKMSGSDFLGGFRAEKGWKCELNN